jgi:DNA-binding MarR family transcriptional regulator
MTKLARMTLLALIEAGQHAHRALLRPLIERGLEPGDDAVLLLLGDGASSESDLEDGTGVAIDTLLPRLERLITREFVVRTATGLALTERGARVHERLLEVWTDTELALTGGLKKKHRKRLARVLITFADYLRQRAGRP